MKLDRKRLATLHRVRTIRRDRIRSAVAQLAASARAASERADAVAADRDETTGAIRSATAVGRVDIDRAAAMRLHAARLGVEAAAAGRERAAAADRLLRGQRLLARADADVKAIERLSERLAAEERAEAERRADREATDRFAARRPAAETSHP